MPCSLGEHAGLNGLQDLLIIGFAAKQLPQIPVLVGEKAIPQASFSRQT